MNEDIAKALGWRKGRHPWTGEYGWYVPSGDMKEFVNVLPDFRTDWSQLLVLMEAMDKIYASDKWAVAAHDGIATVFIGKKDGSSYEYEAETLPKALCDAIMGLNDEQKK